MNDQSKGLLITFLGVAFVVPDAVFIRLIDAGPLTISYWRVTLVGLVIGLGLLALKGTAPFRAVAGTGLNGVIYMIGVGGSGVLFAIAISLTSVANVVFIIASLPVFAAIYSRIFLSEPTAVIGSVIALGGSLLVPLGLGALSRLVGIVLPG